jgi:hypothetical protein
MYAYPYYIIEHFTTLHNTIYTATDHAQGVLSERMQKAGVKYPVIVKTVCLCVFVLACMSK